MTMKHNLKFAYFEECDETDPGEGGGGDLVAHHEEIVDMRMTDKVPS